MPIIPLTRRSKAELLCRLWFVPLLLMALSVGALAAARAPGAGRTPGPSPMAEGERRLTIFYTSGIQGTLEPCGCNSDPLGGVDRYAALVRRAQKEGPVLVVDGGNTTFPAHGLPPQKRQAAKLRAQFVAERLTALGLSAAALGPADLAAGLDALAPPRMAINVKAPMVRPSEVRQVGNVKVGLLGIASEDAATAAGVTAADAVAAAVAEAARLRAQGAELVVAVAAIDRPLARKVARKAAIDFLVLGGPHEEGMAEADAVGQTFIVTAAAELQKAGRLDVVLRAGGPMQNAGTASARTEAAAAVDAKLAGLADQIKKWEADKTTDVAFLQAKRRELEALREQKRKLAGAWAPPPTGSYFVNTLIPMRRALPQDKQVTTAMRALDRAVGKLNLAAAQPPPKAEPQRPHFVGDAACAKCHKQAASFWKGTVHAHAWRTLVEGGKQADLECVGCHVTGYGHVGGSALGFTKGLENVQCEVCHGPGSLHVAEEGLDEPVTVHAQTPESTCVQCHNQKHSDTFEYAAYLRDILGPGHGESLRNRLGKGPTGGELRRAAMAKAKAAGAAQAKEL